MNRKQQGDIGVGQAVAHYMSLGYVVCFPMTDSARYDLVVDDGNSLLRIQVKTSKYKKPSGSYEVKLATSGGNQSWSGVVKKISKDECDKVFVYTLDGDKYEFPAEFLDNKGSVTLDKNKDEYRV
jgi:hypothetical protein